MSGLSAKEQEGFRKLMGLLTTSDLLSLSDTVTNKLIVVENVTEATETILSFSKNAEELLKRKKIQRDIIFKYLAKEGVILSPSSDKRQLIEKTLEYWSSGKVSSGKNRQSDTDDTTEAASDSTDKFEAGFDPLTLGHQFCLWFFQLLNSQNPTLNQQPQDWGTQHFWPDVKLCLFARAGSEQMEDFLGAELVSLRLLALSREERLVFSPNLEPQGLKALASPHGLVIVAVAGTIHRDSNCLGIFEQVFGLIRSPLMNNNWKIKFIKLKIRGLDALGGTGVAAPALNYSSTDLQLLCSS
ncbi:uncharacterized protein C3orf38 homolog [Salarias fasciatus]|uniref:NTF2 domain-containing protein n=1 Tax=Salarias fasciatus TaxID=181472 RepID=A0A672GCW3_SALFA|nr:uncharacterized protein C3orf38 homolog [Salarias fasciatus]